MAKLPQPMSVVAEGKLEGFGVLSRDFNVTLEINPSNPIIGGMVVAQWADPAKPVERWMLAAGVTNHAFGPRPCTIVIYIESETSHWSGIAKVEGFNSLKINLLSKE